MRLLLFALASLQHPGAAPSHPPDSVISGNDYEVMVQFHLAPRAPDDAASREPTFGSFSQDRNAHTRGLRRPQLSVTPLWPLVNALPQEVVDYSDGYYSRLTIHRYASYAMLPLFVLQYISGEQRLTKGRFAPEWTRVSHLPLSVAIGALFSVNLVTGVWNLSESLPDETGRTRKTLHSILMLAASAGFVLTGMLAPDIDTIEQRLTRGDTSWTPHKKVAVGSMGIAVSAWLLMLVWPN